MATVLDTFVTIFEYKVKGLEGFKKQAANVQQLGTEMTKKVTLPLVALAAGVSKLASDMEETQNKIGETFGTSADAVRTWSKDSIHSMGLAQQSALDTAALFGDIATGMGMTEGSAASMATELTQLSADLASFKNIRQSIAQTALSGIFTGETESLKRLGIIITENNLKSFAQSKGVDSNISKMTELQKIQLRYKLVLDATSKAQGDFIRTGGGAANQTRKLTENFKEFGTVVGETILPVVTAGLLKMNAGVQKATMWWTNLGEPMQDAIIALGAVLAISGPLITAISGIALAVAALGLAFNATPIGAMVTIVGLLITGLITAFTWLRRFRRERAKDTPAGVDMPQQRRVFSTLTPVAATPPASLTRTSKTIADQRQFNVDMQVDINEASDGRRISRQIGEEFADTLRSTSQNFRTAEAG